MTGGPAALMFVGWAWQRATDRLFLVGAGAIAVLETVLVAAMLIFAVLDATVA